MPSNYYSRPYAEHGADPERRRDRRRKGCYPLLSFRAEHVPLSPYDGNDIEVDRLYRFMEESGHDNALTYMLWK